MTRLQAMTHEQDNLTKKHFRAKFQKANALGRLGKAGYLLDVFKEDRGAYPTSELFQGA